MSDVEQVDKFNPLIVLIWIVELMILITDYSQDQKITWSIPLIGSFLLIQIYMIWKTNYDKMVQEQREMNAQSMSKEVRDTPLIIPGKTNLQQANSKGNLVNLTLAPSVQDDED